jgi:hypothetical protein
MKRYILAAAVVALILVASPVSASGGLVKLSDSDAVYWTDGAIRLAFPNASVFRSWYGDFSGVSNVSRETMASMRLAGTVTYRPGSRLVKITTDPKTYAVDEGGVLRWITTETAARKLYGEGWAKLVDDVPDSLFAGYAVGQPISSASDFSPSVAYESARIRVQVPYFPPVVAQESPAYQFVGINEMVATVETNPVTTIKTPDFEMTWHETPSIVCYADKRTQAERRGEVGKCNGAVVVAEVRNASGKLASMGRIVVVVEAREGAIIGGNMDPALGVGVNIFTADGRSARSPASYVPEVKLPSFFGGTVEIDTSVIGKVYPSEFMRLSFGLREVSSTITGRVSFTLLSPDGDVTMPPPVTITSRVEKSPFER